MRRISWNRLAAASVTALAATSMLAACVSSGAIVPAKGEASSLVDFRAAERAAAAVPAVGESQSLAAFRAGERASASTATEAQSLAAFRAGERASGGAATSGSVGAPGRYVR